MKDIIIEIELHSVEGIKSCFANGINPNEIYNSKPLIYQLLSEYTRSSRFKDCVQIFIDYGLEFEDEVLLAVLTDDANKLESLFLTNQDILNRKYSFKSAYTPIKETSLLHICAEFNLIECAMVLVKYGADINSRAGIDENGFGAQTPIFHTVNQNMNQSKEMFDFLLSKSADLRITIPGLIWGKGYAWETLIPGVNPISYAMMGLLPQMHRKEETISEIVTVLLEAAYGIKYTPSNVPCKYLSS